MRIHRLEISAFGPFAGTERIDFDRLSAHGLFLLNGATGAGKTSVLDAICFALYGSVPGARQDGKRLRSDHAETAAEPRVTCEFSAKGRHFEVSRSPAWNKPSARGKNGFTVQQANTLLRERIDGVWTEKSGRNDEAGAEIADVLGMNRDQFTRVVMLPQGDFAAFLRSKASDRLELLQSLFGTQRFEAVEQELSRQAQAAKTEVASLTSRLDLLLSQAESETAALELDAEGAPGRDAPDALLAWLGDAAATAADVRRTAAAAAEKAVRQAALLEAANARASRQAKLAAAELRRNDADAAAPGLAEQAVTLGLHRKAEVLGGQLRAVESAEDGRGPGGNGPGGGRAGIAVRGCHRPRARRTGPLRSWAASTPALPSAADSPPSTAQPSAARSDGCGPCAPCSTERLPDEARLAGLTDRRGRLRGSCRTWKPGSGPAPPPWTPCALNRPPCSPEYGRSRNLPPKSSCAPRRPTAADELVTIVGRYLDAEAVMLGHRGTARRGPDRTPGLSAALARPPRTTAHQRRSRARRPAARRRSLPGLR